MGGSCVYYTVFSLNFFCFLHCTDVALKGESFEKWFFVTLGPIFNALEKPVPASHFLVWDAHSTEFLTPCPHCTENVTG